MSDVNGGRLLKVTDLREHPLAENAARGERVCSPGLARVVALREGTGVSVEHLERHVGMAGLTLVERG